MSNIVPFGSGGISPFGQSRESRDLARLGARGRGEVEIRGQITAMKEQYRAELANQALTNVGALSSLEQSLAQAMPSSAPRFKAVVDAYTAGAINTLMRF